MAASALAPAAAATWEERLLVPLGSQLWRAPGGSGARDRRAGAQHPAARPVGTAAGAACGFWQSAGLCRNLRAARPPPSALPDAALPRPPPAVQYAVPPPADAPPSSSPGSGVPPPAPAYQWSPTFQPGLGLRHCALRPACPHVIATQPACWHVHGCSQRLPAPAPCHTPAASCCPAGPAPYYHQPPTSAGWGAGHACGGAGRGGGFGKTLAAAGAGILGGLLLGEALD